jgi:hypothetical protein
MSLMINTYDELVNNTFIDINNKKYNKYEIIDEICSEFNYNVNIIDNDNTIDSNDLSKIVIILNNKAQLFIALVNSNLYCDLSDFDKRDINHTFVDTILKFIIKYDNTSFINENLNNYKKFLIIKKIYLYITNTINDLIKKNQKYINDYKKYLLPKINKNLIYNDDITINYILERQIACDIVAIHNSINFIELNCLMRELYYYKEIELINTYQNIKKLISQNVKLELVNIRINNNINSAIFAINIIINENILKIIELKKRQNELFKDLNENLFGNQLLHRVYNNIL